MSLMANQIEAIDHLKHWKVGALFMEAGSGKTRVACELINQIPCADLLLWIAPLRTIEGLKKEVSKWINGSFDIMFAGVESLSNSDAKYIEIYNSMKDHNCTFMVVDESLKIKNAEAKRTKRVIELGKMAKYRIVLNGTPVSRNLLDLWTQMEFLSPLILKMSYAEFMNTFCVYDKINVKSGRGSFSKMVINGYANVDSLHNLISPYVYECDLSLQIKQNYHELRYTISHGNRVEYTKIKNKYLTNEILLLKNNNIFMEMTQKMQHVYSNDESKFAILDRLFKEIDEATSIIFCKFISSRTECEKRYKNALVLSYQKEGFGLNLQMYKTIIYFDKTWDYAMRIQSSRRIFRIGQKYDCHYYDLTGDVGLEKMIDDNIRKKVSISEYLKAKNIEEIRSAL